MHGLTARAKISNASQSGCNVVLSPGNGDAILEIKTGGACISNGGSEGHSADCHNDNGGTGGAAIIAIVARVSAADFDAAQAPAVARVHPAADQVTATVVVSAVGIRITVAVGIAVAITVRISGKTQP